MKTNLNRSNVKSLNILNGLSPSSSVEAVRIVFKSAGVSAYLPRSIVEFLNLHREDRSLVALLDSGEYNYVVLIADRDLISLLKPIILARRQKAQRLQEKLKAQLKAQLQQQSKKETAQVLVDVWGDKNENP